MTWLAASIAAVIVVGAGLAVQFASSGRGPSQRGNPTADPVAAFVGSESCADCHETEAQLWRGSQHKHAMDHATETSVLGDFNDASFDYAGVRSHFFRKDGRFLVETDGPDGALATFEIGYTFGVDPLQQYLVEFSDGRLQALSIAWDSRPKEKGGQRWFHLYSNEAIGHNDILHWTKLNQNWNFMCAECHSTGVHKNYDAANDRFATTWAEISVGCEACHGQGSRHVRWAEDRQSWWPFGKGDDPSMGLLVRFDERSGVSWHQHPITGLPERGAAPQILRREIETCGLCHARRGALSEDWVPGRWLSETHAISTLDRGLYEADGQMLGEVYNYGSFKQSRMFAAGVTCSDCHDPHSAALRVPGDGTCSQCHAADRYATATHHHHDGADPPLDCASCHMPVRTYMAIDRRRDHSFRIPRPDVSAKLGPPNVCTDCHTDKSAEWAASAVERWYGPDRKGLQTYAEAFHAAWSDQPEAERLLAAVAADRGTPGMVRASALTELASHLTPANIDLARAGLADPDPMVRIGALDMLENAPPEQQWTLGSPSLSDVVRGVRIRAASLLASIPSTQLSVAERERFERAASEFIAAQRLNADRPESRAELGHFLARRGLVDEAEAEYRTALNLSPGSSPAAINLADLYRERGRDGEGESLLRRALAVSPQDAALHHALGLTLMRLKRPGDAIEELRRGAELDPDQARYAFVYAIGLQSSGRADDAMTVLEKSLALHPGDRDLLMALITFNRDAGSIKTALEYAERLARIVPANPDLARFIEDLRAQAK